MALRGGIDLGGTKIESVVVDGDGAVVGQARHPTPHDGGPRAVINALAGGLREAAKAAGVRLLVGAPVRAPRLEVSRVTGAWLGEEPVAARWVERRPFNSPTTPPTP